MYRIARFSLIEVLEKRVSPTLIVLAFTVMAALSACGGDATATTTTSPMPEPSTTSLTSTTGGVDSTTTPTPAPETTTSTGAAQDVVEVTVESGEVVGGPQRIRVDLGSTVRAVVVSDAVDQIHVHGYDLFFEVAPGSQTEIVFTADVPGIFEVELEDSHLVLMELEVR